MTLHHGDCLEVMATLPAASVDAIVCDPPYDLTTGRTLQMGPLKPEHADSTARRKAGGFMGKAWDGTGVAFDAATWALALRVAKPGAYLLAFGGTRTYHRLACAIEDAGWIIRDCLVWAYAQGFPKSRALLKPAWEPIVMARKPGPLRELAIDACRIGVEQAWRYPNGPKGNTEYSTIYGNGDGLPRMEEPREGPLGRWPANVILTDPIFDGGIDGVVGGGEAGGSGPASGPTWTGPSGSPSRSPMAGMGNREPQFYGDTGTYSRFFLIPKADRGQREPNDYGRLGLDEAEYDYSGPRGHALNGDGTPRPRPRPRPRTNVHPTVKPLDLMRHLVRLVTPPAGTVLDPFLGSGTTAIAAEMEGFAWIGIEREAEYVAIAEARLQGVQRGMGLSA